MKLTKSLIKTCKDAIHRVSKSKNVIHHVSKSKTRFITSQKKQIINKNIMKKLFIAFSAIIAMAIGAKAQTNIQIQYDFGEKRQNITTTLEMFKTDNWGSTFFFVDITHDGKFQHQDGVSFSAPIGAYTEIARALNFWQNTKLGALSAHVEYNGGLGVVPNVFGYGINNSWLFGAEYFLHSKDFRYTLTLEVLYKTIAKSTQDVPLQFTIVWGCKDLFGVKGLLFDGFADFLWEDNKIGRAHV